MNLTRRQFLIHSAKVAIGAIVASVVGVFAGREVLAVALPKADAGATFGAYNAAIDTRLQALVQKRFEDAQARRKVHEQVWFDQSQEAVALEAEELARHRIRPFGPTNYEEIDRQGQLCAQVSGLSNAKSFYEYVNEALEVLGVDDGARGGRIYTRGGRIYSDKMVADLECLGRTGRLPDSTYSVTRNYPTINLSGKLNPTEVIRAEHLAGMSSV